LDKKPLGCICASNFEMARVTSGPFWLMLLSISST
jgi:hypothetical protein